MISSIWKALVSLKRPSVFAPAAIVAVLQSIVFYFAIEPYLTLLLDALNQNLPNADPLQFPFIAYQRYFNEFNVLMIAWLVGIALQVWLLFVLSRYAKEPSAKNSMQYAGNHYGSVIGTVVFAFLIAFLGFSLYMLISWIGEFNALASSILLIVLGVIALFIGVKLSFFVPSMALDEVKLKQGLQNSWKFSHGKFWPIVVLLILLGLIGNAFNLAAGYWTQSISTDWMVLLVSAILSMIATTWVGLSMANYYQEKSNS